MNASRFTIWDLLGVFLFLWLLASYGYSLFALNSELRALSQRLGELAAINGKLLERIDAGARAPAEPAGALTKEALSKGLGSANLTESEIRKIADAAVQNLAAEIESDSTGKTRKLIEDLAQKAPGSEQTLSSKSPLWPLIERALQGALRLVLPSEKAAIAAKALASLSETAMSEVSKVLIGEIVKDTYSWLRGKDSQKVFVTCNCAQKRDEAAPPVTPLPPEDKNKKGKPVAPAPQPTDSVPPENKKKEAEAKDPEKAPIVVMFRTNSASVAHETQREQIWRAMALYRSAPDTDLVLYAYTDKTGNIERNRILRKDRAESVKRALLRIDPSLRVRIQDTSKEPAPVFSTVERIPGNRAVVIRSERASVSR